MEKQEKFKNRSPLSRNQYARVGKGKTNIDGTNPEGLHISSGGLCAEFSVGAATS